MNAPARIEPLTDHRLNPEAGDRNSGGSRVTPADLAITVRDERFGRNAGAQRWWHGGDPIATAFYNALSVTFPKGEAFFIESVKAFREGTPPQLEAEIRAFVKQEINHTREHVAFNRKVVDAGYDISRLEAKVDESLALSKGRPAIANLAATMVLEHFTAILAQQILTDPRHFEGADPESRAMWKWHAIEEIEHKGVAYDTWLHATRDWSRFKRWRIKSLLMLVVTKEFTVKRAQGMLDLLAQDGLRGPKVWWALFRYAFAKPGIARKIAGAWLSFFMPGFHPWKHDDRELIQLGESDYRAALKPAA